MASGAVLDLLAALALLLVIEGLAVALLSSRLEGLLEQLRVLDREQLRWAGLGMAILGLLGYLLIRG